MTAEVQRAQLLKQLQLRAQHSKRQEQGQASTAGGESQHAILNGSQGPISSIMGVEKELEHFLSHDIIKGVLDHGRLISDFARGVDEELQQTERESVQVLEMVPIICTFWNTRIMFCV
jgi:hypothetical protein